MNPPASVQSRRSPSSSRWWLGAALSMATALVACDAARADKSDDDSAEEASERKKDKAKKKRKKKRKKAAKGSSSKAQPKAKTEAASAPPPVPAEPAELVDLRALLEGPVIPGIKLVKDGAPYTGHGLEAPSSWFNVKKEWRFMRKKQDAAVFCEASEWGAGKEWFVTPKRLRTLAKFVPIKGKGLEMGPETTVLIGPTNIEARAGTMTGKTFGKEGGTVYWWDVRWSKKKVDNPTTFDALHTFCLAASQSDTGPGFEEMRAIVRNYNPKLPHILEPKGAPKE